MNIEPPLYVTPPTLSLLLLYITPPILHHASYSTSHLYTRVMITKPHCARQIGVGLCI